MAGWAGTPTTTKTLNHEETTRGHITAVIAVNRVHDITALCTLQRYIKSKEEKERNLTAYLEYIEGTWLTSKMEREEPKAKETSQHTVTEEDKKYPETTHQYPGKSSHHHSSTTTLQTHKNQNQAQPPPTTTSQMHKNQSQAQPLSTTKSQKYQNQAQSPSTTTSQTHKNQPTRVFIDSTQSTKYAISSLFPKNSYEVKEVDQGTPQKSLSFILIQEESRQTEAKVNERIQAIPIITSKIVVIILKTQNAFLDEESVKKSLIAFGADKVTVLTATIGFAQSDDGTYGYVITQNDLEKLKENIAVLKNK